MGIMDEFWAARREAELIAREFTAAIADGTIEPVIEDDGPDE